MLKFYLISDYICWKTLCLQKRGWSFLVRIVNVFQVLIILVKISMIDVWHSSRYTSVPCSISSHLLEQKSIPSDIGWTYVEINCLFGLKEQLKSHLQLWKLVCLYIYVYTHKSYIYMYIHTSYTWRLHVFRLEFKNTDELFTIFRSTVKVCVRYCSSIFYFFTKW